MDYVYYPNYLEHHGILGMKWGIRRYQNEDGSYTSAGKEHRKTLGQHVREYSLKSTKRAIDRSRSNIRYYDAWTQEYDNQASKYKAQRSEAKGRREMAKANAEKHENSLTSKLIGPNTAKLKKYQKEYDKADYDYRQADAKYQEAKGNRNTAEYKSMENEQRLNSQYDSFERQTKKYIKKYGSTPLVDLGLIEVV